MISLRPSGVHFVSATHQYFLDGHELKGITSTLIKRAFPDDYKGIPESVLRNAAERGSNVHEVIELYEDIGAESDMPELRNYINIKAAHHLDHVVSEYVVTDGALYATAIDHVFTDILGGIVIADIKTTYTKNYEKTALQLSICKRFFEMTNPGLKVSECAMIWLRGEECEYKVLTPYAEEVIDNLIEADLSDNDFSITSAYGNLPAKFAEVEAEIAHLEIHVKQEKVRLEELRKGLYDLMEAHNVKSFTGSCIKLSRVLPSEVKTFDSKAFKADNPELYEKYCKPTKKAGSLRVTLI